MVRCCCASSTRGPASRWGGAEVRFLDAGKPYGSRRMHGPSEIRTHRSERVGALGSLHRTDEKGELRLPPFVKNACVSASHEGLYDYTSLRAGKDESDVRFVVQK